MTSYSLHYLMFRRCPRLPVDYYFPTVSTFEHSHHVPAYLMEVRRWFKEAYAEAHLQMNCEAKKQKRYYDKAMSTVQLVPGYVVLIKNDTYQGKQKVKDRRSETEYVVVHQVTDGVPAYEVNDEALRLYTATDCFLWPPQWGPSHPWGQVCCFQKKTLLNPPLQNVPHLR